MGQATAERDKTPKLRRPRLPRVTEQVLQDITRHIVEAVHPEKVILFGSRAYGKPKADSDVDLMVIVNTDLDRVERYSRVSRALWEHGLVMPTDILVRTPAEIQQRLAIGDFFIREVLGRGRVLYQRDHGNRTSGRVD